jgi:branched-chain amino acid transport system ATP-binding protein
MLLRTRDLSAGYNSVPVAHGLNLTVGEGEVVALMGPNGAGKTTTLMTLAGELPLIEGEVELNGEVTTAPLHRRAKRGLSFVTEERAIFRSMSTIDNLRVAGVPVDEALSLFPELGERLKVSAGLLSGGEQQMLALARSLGRKPKLLLADELSLGLAPLAVERLLEAVRAAADRDGVGVLLVEQHLASALAVADRAYVMRRGRIELEGTAADLRERMDEIEDTYLSASAELLAASRTSGQPGD